MKPNTFQRWDLMSTHVKNGMGPFVWLPFIASFRNSLVELMPAPMADTRWCPFAVTQKRRVKGKSPCHRGVRTARVTAVCSTSCGWHGQHVTCARRRISSVSRECVRTGTRPFTTSAPGKNMLPGPIIIKNLKLLFFYFANENIGNIGKSK